MIICIPEILKNKIGRVTVNVRGHSSTLFHNSCKFFFSLVGDSIKYKGLPGVNVDYSKDKVRSLLGRNYIELLSAFENEDLIKIDHTAIKGKKARSYQVNTTLLDGEFISFSIPDKTYEEIEDSSLRVLEDCKLDVSAAQEFTESFSQSDKIFDSIKVDDDIPDGILSRVLVYSIKTGRFKELEYIEKHRLLKDWYTPGFELLKHKKRYFYMPLELYRAQRRQEVRFSYHNSIVRFAKKEYHITRDLKGNRLHTNITNMPSKLIRFISYKGESFIEYDLSCSQWCFLVYCIENPQLENLISQAASQTGFNTRQADYINFKVKAQSGRLYEWVMEELGLTEREEAKQLLFEVLFGTRRRTYRKNLIRTILPSIIDFLDQMKMEYGYKKIPVELQKTEATVF